MVFPIPIDRRFTHMRMIIDPIFKKLNRMSVHDCRVGKQNNVTPGGKSDRVEPFSTLMLTLKSEWNTFMADQEQIDFNVDKNNLYREEAITDLKVASIRRMIPVTIDGKDDPSRTPIYFGHTQIITPQGPLPLQARLMANTLAEAIDAFPQAMESEMAQVVEQIRKMQQAEAQKQKQDDSRIIVPGR